MADRKWFGFIDVNGDTIIIAASRIVTIRVRLSGEHQELGATVRLKGGEEVDVQNKVKDILAQM